MEKHYRIADINVSMSVHGRTYDQAQAYQFEFDGIVSPLEYSTENFKMRHPEVTDDIAEYMASGMAFYRMLIDNDGFMLHSSAVVVDGKAYLFSAHSGTGKSTHTQLWLQQFGDRAFILNDDKPALRRVNGVWFAYGTPWSGKYDISVNTGVPIAGIAMLERGEKNEITPYSGKEAIFDLFVQTNRPRAAEYRIKLMELMDSLMQSVPVWKLKCNMDPEAAVVAYEAMSGKKVVIDK